MEQVTSTRTELLQRRAQLDLARQGRDLLMEKRDQLMQEFQRVASVALRGSDELAGAATAARRALDLADAMDGPEEVAAAAFVTGGELTLGVRAVTLMGVRIADISYPAVGRTATSRGYSLLATSPRIDAAAERFEAEVELLLEVASLEVRLRRLADEIGKATRRINAIELVVIPRLEAERKFIQSVLDERERQERFRLKRIRDRPRPDRRAA